MTNTTVKHKEHTLWSNYLSDLNFDDWKDDLTEYYPELDESMKLIIHTLMISVFILKTLFLICQLS